MGSYDTAEISIGNRSRSTYRSEDVEPENRVPLPSDDEETINTSNYNTPTNSNYDPNNKTIVALGGGLTPSRIVQPLPDEVRDGTIREVVKYLMSDDIAVNAVDKSIVDAINSRMTKANYRLIINETANKFNSEMDAPMVKYLRQQEKQGAEGTIKYNFADIAIVSHEEGGSPELEYRLN